MIIYKKLFELSILHQYYTNKLCPDFILEPTIECRKILNGHRLLVKNKMNGIVVIVPIDSSSQKPQIKITDDLQFTFVLKLKNPKILNFTEGNFKDNIFFNPQQDDDLKCLSFSNKSRDKLGVVLLQEGCLLVSFMKLNFPNELEAALSLLLEIYVALSLAEKLLEKPIELSQQDLPRGLNTKVILYEHLPSQKEEVLLLAEKLLETPIELSQQDLPPGLKTKVILYENLTDELQNKVILYESLSQEKYETLSLAKELLGKEKIKLSDEDLPGGQVVWGLVIIDSQFFIPIDSSSTNNYQITLNTKKQNWYYYVITNDDKTELSIKDNQKKISFSRFKVVTDQDPMRDTLDRQFPETNKYLSESTSKITCQEAGRKDIKLSKGENVLIEHLPNPPNDNIIQIPVVGSGLDDSNEIIQYQVINLLKNS